MQPMQPMQPAYPWPYPRIVAHRGGGTLAPENTLAALRCALQYGFSAVEFDVMCAADGVPVLMHDAQLGRTVAAVGMRSALISDYPAHELQQMDAGKWLAPQFAGEAVPLFSQAIDFCTAHQLWMNIEIKPTPGSDIATGRSVASTLQACLKTHALAASANQLAPLFSSFSFAALEAAKQTVPEIARGLLVDRIPADWQAQLDFLDAVTLHTNHEHLSPSMARAIKQAGFGLFCYTVNDSARAREILSWGVDGFCTDQLDIIGANFS